MKYIVDALVVVGTGSISGYLGARLLLHLLHKEAVASGKCPICGQPTTGR